MTQRERARVQLGMPNFRTGHGRLRRFVRSIALATALVVLVMAASCTPAGRPDPRASVRHSKSPSPSLSLVESSAVIASVRVTTLSARLPSALSRAAIVKQRGTLLVLGGLTAKGSSTTILSIDPVSGQIQTAGDLAVRAHDATAASIGDRIFVFGGGDKTHTIDSVQEITGRSSRVVGHLPQPRSDLVTAAQGQSAFILGGFDGKNPTPDVLSTSDGVTFRKVATLTQPVRYPGIVLKGGTIYLFGGELRGRQTRAIQAIDLATGTSRVIAQLPAPRSHEMAVLVGQEILLIGGRSGASTLTSIERVEPETGLLQSLGNLPTPLADSAAEVIGKTVYLVGGEQPARSDRILAIDPA